MPASIREAYVQHGVTEWYAQHGADYRNPHEEGVRKVVLSWVERLPSGRLLDLACGSGEVTLALRETGLSPSAIDGADPYTGAAYQQRTGQTALPWSFEGLAGGLPGEYGAVICSFALHLCPPSRLPQLIGALAASSEALLVLTPHKKPELRAAWGMVLEEERYDKEYRVRSRLYRSERRP